MWVKGQGDVILSDNMTKSLRKRERESRRNDPCCHVQVIKYTHAHTHWYTEEAVMLLQIWQPTIKHSVKHL